MSNLSRLLFNCTSVMWSIIICEHIGEEISIYRNSKPDENYTWNGLMCPLVCVRACMCVCVVCVEGWCECMCIVSVGNCVRARVCVCVCRERGGGSVCVYCERRYVWLGCNNFHYGFNFQRIKTSSASENLPRQSLPCGAREKEKERKRKHHAKTPLPTHAKGIHRKHILTSFLRC